MSDQQAPTPAVDTPAVAGPNEAPGTAQDQPHDIPAGYIPEQRYKDVQAEYTRSQQALKEAQEREQWFQALVTSDDPDTQRQAAEILGFELPDDEDDGEGFEEFTGEDPYEERFRALEERLSSFNEQAQTAMEAELIADNAHSQFEELDMGEGKADDKTREIIFKHAYSLPRVPAGPGGPREGYLDIKGAIEELTSWAPQWAQAQAKARPRAPHVPTGGLPANEVPNSGTGHNARMARAMQWFHNNQGDE